MHQNNSIYIYKLFLTKKNYFFLKYGSTRVSKRALTYKTELTGGGKQTFFFF